MADAARMIGWIVVMALCVAAPFAMGVWILRPLDRAAKNREAPVQFTMMDFLGLMFLLQVPLALSRALLPDRHMWNAWVVGGFAFVATAAIWAVAIRTFSRAGIRNARQRAVLVFLVMPMAYVGVFAVVIVPFPIYQAGTHGSMPVQLVVVELLLIVGISYSGYFTRWVAHEPVER